MKLNITAAEELLNERLDIIENVFDSPADKAYLNGAVQALRSIGLSPEIRDGKFVIFGGDQ